MLDTRFLAVTLILLAGACAPHQQPDLVRLYASAAEKPKAHPLIVIPGIMGSRLHRADGDREIWPGSLWKLMIAGDFDNLALTIPGSEAIAGAPRPAELETGGIFHEIAGEDFYAQIIETLSDAGGYTCVPREKVTAQSDCVLFAWDWREGMVAAARELDNLVERLRRLRVDPSLRVDVVAHSAGGLVTRYFVRFGGVDVLDEIEPSITFAGGRKVRQAILIGTPNYGSITALQKAITGYRIGLTGMRQETTATMQTTSSSPYPRRSSSERKSRSSVQETEPTNETMTSGSRVSMRRAWALDSSRSRSSSAASSSTSYPDSAKSCRYQRLHRRSGRA